MLEFLAAFLMNQTFIQANSHQLKSKNFMSESDLSYLNEVPQYRFQLSYS